MAIKMIREPSVVPNISNIDDFVGLRYAYGNQNGFCSGRGNELGYSVSGSIFKLQSGRVVVQGVECDIDANGVEIPVDSVATQRYHTVYAQISLANMSVAILEVYDTAGFPAVDLGDDLTKNTVGTARLELYHFASLSGVISQVEKLVKPIIYMRSLIPVKATDSTERYLLVVGADGQVCLCPDLTYVADEGFLKVNEVGGQKSCKILVGDDGYFTDKDTANTVYLIGSQSGSKGTLDANLNGNAYSASYTAENKSKTIEQRLQDLGFREDSVAGLSGTAVINKVTRQGNYIRGDVVLNSNLLRTVTTTSGSFTFCTLPLNFRPKQEVKVGVLTQGLVGSSYTSYIQANYAIIGTDGVVTVYYSGKLYSGTGVTQLDFLGLGGFGFEANPI